MFVIVDRLLPRKIVTEFFNFELTTYYTVTFFLKLAFLIDDMKRPEIYEETSYFTRIRSYIKNVSTQ